MLVGLTFWLVKLMATFYQFFQFWDISNFFSQALHISDGELESLTWREVQKRLVDAQKDHQMCIHKDQLTDLDIYHRILRFKNYLVSMVNKDILPLRLTLLPCLPSFMFLSHGLKFNLEWLFFKVRYLLSSSGIAIRRGSCHNVVQFTGTMGSFRQVAFER